MSLKKFWRASCATAALTSMFAQPALAGSKLGQAIASDPALAADAPADFGHLRTAQLVQAARSSPASSPALRAAVEAFVNSPAAPPRARKLFAAYASDPSVGPEVAHMIKQAVLRSKIRHVFVIFQENRSFAAIGNQAELYRRDLGDASKLRLPVGPNAPLEQGGALLSIPVSSSR